MTWHRTSLPNMDISNCTHVQQDLHFYNHVYTALSPFSMFELIYYPTVQYSQKEEDIIHYHTVEYCQKGNDIKGISIFPFS